MTTAIDAVPRGLAGAAPAAARDRAPMDAAPAARPLSPDLALLAAAGFPPGPLLAAMARAARAGVEPLDALLAAGTFSEDVIVGALALGLGARVADETDRDGPAIDAETCGHALRKGLVRLDDPSGEPTLYVAARGHHVARLALAARGRPRRARLALATPRAFADLVIARTGAALAAHASEGPSLVAPALSVRDGLPAIGRGLQFLLVGLIFAGFVATFALEVAGGLVLGLTSLLFATLNLFRLYVACTPPTPAPRVARDDDRSLPVYTVLVPLAREAAVVPGLMAALERLDYPALGSKRTKSATVFSDVG